MSPHRTYIYVKYVVRIQTWAPNWLHCDVHIQQYLYVVWPIQQMHSQLETSHGSDQSFLNLDQAFPGFDQSFLSLDQAFLGFDRPKLFLSPDQDFRWLRSIIAESWPSRFGFDQSLLSPAQAVLTLNTWITTLPQALSVPTIIKYFCTL